MCSKNWLIIFLVLLGAGLVLLKNREKSVPVTPQETAQPASVEQTPEQITAPEQAAPQETPSATPVTKEETGTQPVPVKAVPEQHPTEIKTKQAAPEKKAAVTEAPKAPAETPAAPVKAGSAQPVTTTDQLIGEQRTISIQNAITKKMLGYRYFGTHYPTSFKITANGKEIKEESKEFIKLANNQVTIRYTFEFLNGKRKGAKEITFAVKPNADNLSIAFDWKDTWRILIDKEKAEPISAKQIE